MVLQKASVTKALYETGAFAVVRINMTLIFSAPQALLVANAAQVRRIIDETRASMK